MARRKRWLALCLNCSTYPKPFHSKQDRNRWLADHIRWTGHEGLKAGAIVEVRDNVWRTKR